ncbi:MAG: chemotaxis protein CheW [Nitrospirae bacterium]|nr:chemotaxis protein CheW [Nitrospirota bacterium]
MDIAKIRKKIKEELEIRRGGKEGKSVSIGDPPWREGSAQPMTQGKSEDKAADDITAGAQQPLAGSGKTEDSHLRQPASAGSQGLGAKSQTQVPAQVFSESRQIGTESVSKAVNPQEAVSGLPALSARQTGIIELLTFQLAAEEFAFRISEVGEILTPQQITMVPKAPDYILGITSVRGKVMPVLDLKKRLSIKDNGASSKVRKKILTLKGPKGRIGTMIDRVNGVIRIDESDIVEPPAHLSESELMFVEGVVLYNGRFISVIRLEEAVDINLK